MKTLIGHSVWRKKLDSHKPKQVVVQWNAKQRGKVMKTSPKNIPFINIRYSFHLAFIFSSILRPVSFVCHWTPSISLLETGLSFTSFSYSAKLFGRVWKILTWQEKGRRDRGEIIHFLNATGRLTNGWRHDNLGATWIYYVQTEMIGRGLDISFSCGCSTVHARDPWLAQISRRMTNKTGRLEFKCVSSFLSRLSQLFEP